MTTEFHQPINPTRIVTGDAEWSFTIPVFAIAISNDYDVEYVTINGDFYMKSRIKFAEVMINGQWTRLEGRQSKPT